jgi:hypothetical protein
VRVGATAVAFCSGCGRPVAECAGCTRALDPPRFCETCGRRLKVQVTPAGYTTTCRTCDQAGR